MYTDGSAACWGQNGYGQSTVPAGTWLALSTGILHTCGLRTDGSLACWGANGSPVVTDTPRGAFRALSSGTYHACAIRDTGTLACWGGNYAGESSPPAGTFVQVSSGDQHSCAIRSDGVRMCWGADEYGANPDVRIDPSSLPNALISQPYDQQLTLTGSGNYSAVTPAFAVVGGNLPPGLELAAGGHLSGVPVTSGSFAFTIEAEDANGFVASRAYTLAVSAELPPAEAVEAGIEEARAAGDISPAVASMLLDSLWSIQEKLAWIAANPSSPDLARVKNETCSSINAFNTRMDHWVRLRRLPAHLRDEWKADMLEVKTELGCR